MAEITDIENEYLILIYTTFNTRLTMCFQHTIFTMNR